MLLELYFINKRL